VIVRSYTIIFGHKVVNNGKRSGRQTRMVMVEHKREDDDERVRQHCRRHFYSWPSLGRLPGLKKNHSMKVPPWLPLPVAACYDGGSGAEEGNGNGPFITQLESKSDGMLSPQMIKSRLVYLWVEVFTGAVQVILRQVSFYPYQYKKEQWFQEKVFTGLVWVRS
jgi:hypothetical protein